MDLKTKIIEATIEEFNEKGLKFTMDDLSRHLGISKKTLYHEFESKEELFLEVIERFFAQVKKGEREIFEDTSLEIIEKIKKIIIVLPECCTNIDFRKLYELEQRYPKIYNKIILKIDEDWTDTIQLLNQAIEEGKIRPINLIVLKTIICSSIEAFIKKDILIKEKIGYAEALEEMINIIIEGIRM